MSLQLRDRCIFFLEWIKAPLRTASVIPSSRYLARKMAQGLTEEEGPVIELGPGTGVFTRHILARGVKEEDLILVELNPSFAERMRKKYPKATIIEGSAEDLAKLKLERTPRAVVSGLPLLSMPDQVVQNILHGAFCQLKENGVFIQFTYSYKCPVKERVMDKTGLASRFHGFVPLNFPPARVYHFHRKSA